MKFLTNLLQALISIGFGHDEPAISQKMGWEVLLLWLLCHKLPLRTQARASGLVVVVESTLEGAASSSKKFFFA